MKWYKHISDSLDDPFIFDLMSEFGSDGYLVFFGILEIYAREYKPEPNWNLTVTRAYLKQKLHKRQDTLVIKVLEVIKNSGKWDVSFNGRHVTVYIPKFTELLDDWTNRLLRSSSEVTPKKHRTDKDIDKDIDIDKEDKIKKNPLTPQKFLFFWESYPYKKSKGQAEKAWKKIKPNAELFDEIIKGLDRAKKSQNWNKDNGEYIPYPATWLNAKGWEDEDVEIIGGQVQGTTMACKDCGDSGRYAGIDETGVCTKCRMKT